MFYEFSWTSDLLPFLTGVPPPCIFADRDDDFTCVYFRLKSKATMAPPPHHVTSHHGTPCNPFRPQPDLAKSLLEQIREAHQDYLRGLDGCSGASGGKGPAAGGSGGGGEAGRGSGGDQQGGKSPPGGSAGRGSEGAGGGAPSSSAWLEADALALAPLFAEHASSVGEMNFLNKTQGAMSLAADVAGIASGIGRGGSLAGFLRDLGHTCCSTPAALRQAIRVRGYSSSYYC